MTQFGLAFVPSREGDGNDAENDQKMCKEESDARQTHLGGEFVDIWILS